MLHNEKTTEMKPFIGNIYYKLRLKHETIIRCFTLEMYRKQAV